MNKINIADLRTIFAELYSDSSSIRRIIDDAGIERSRIELNSNSIDNWHSILTEAIHVNKIDVLIERVEREYGTNLKFQYACEAYRESISNVETKTFLISSDNSVFVAYSHADRDFAQRLIQGLQKVGIQIWIDKVGLRPGTRNWERAVRSAISVAKHVLLIASPQSRQSTFVQDELAIARMYDHKIIPVWVAGEYWVDSVPLGMGQTQYIDARQENYDTAVEMICIELGIAQNEKGVVEELLLPVVDVNFTPRNPYKGLHSFTEKDKEDFFGREELLDDLVAMLNQHGERGNARLLSIIGPSGSGKSSVVMAGLLPWLELGAVPDSQQWVHLPRMTPGAYPLENLSVALKSASPNSSFKTIREDLEVPSARGLHLWARQITTNPKTRLVLFIDQFEELFTQTESEDERRQFINLLVTAITEPDGPVTVILTLRADFYDRPMRYPELSKLLEANNRSILPMSLTELYRVIQKPAALPDVQLAFDTDLVAELVFEVRDQAGGLPLLQFTLDQLFMRRDGQKLTMKAYREIGGLRGALARHCETTYSLLPSEQHRYLARILFLRLIEPGSSERDTTRRRADMNELTFSDHVQTQQMKDVVNAFIQARLLTTNQVTEITTVEVSHEALINEWKRLKDWVGQHRDDLELQHIISAATSDWLKRNKPVDQLYRGLQLVEAQAWAARNIPSQAEMTFITASADHRIRMRRYQRILLGSIVGLIVTVLVMISGALYVRNEMQREANAQQSAANEELGQRATEVAQERDVSQSRALAAGAQQALNQGNPGEALALAVAALNIDNPPREATLALFSAASSYWVRNQLRDGHTSFVQDLAVSADGALVVSASDDMSLVLWDAKSGALIRRFQGHTESVNGVDFSPDGKKIVSGSSDKTVALWDVATGEQIWTLKGHTDIVLDVAFSPDGKSVLSASADKTLILWDLTAGKQIRTLMLRKRKSWRKMCEGENI